jgi:hypothetical protein
MNEWMNKLTSEWMNEWTNEWMNKWICEHIISGQTDQKNAASAHSLITLLETSKTLLCTDSF